jgi:STE24 endopeptidase
VVLWDTLIRRFSPPEVRVVLAHEFAHLARHHLWKLFAWMALLGVPIAFLVALATRRRGGLYEPAAVPLAIFVVAALLLVTLPLQNAFSRRLEAEADWVALQTTRDPAAMTDLFRRLGRLSKAQPDPPGWDEVMFGDHPSIIKRIEMAQAWKESYPGR